MIYQNWIDIVEKWPQCPNIVEKRELRSHLLQALYRAWSGT